MHLCCRAKGLNLALTSHHFVRMNGERACLLICSVLSEVRHNAVFVFCHLYLGLDDSSNPFLTRALGISASLNDSYILILYVLLVSVFHKIPPCLFVTIISIFSAKHTQRFRDVTPACVHYFLTYVTF